MEMQVLTWLLGAVGATIATGWVGGLLFFLAGVYLGFDTDYLQAAGVVVLIGGIANALKGGNDGNSHIEPIGQ